MGEMSLLIERFDPIARPLLQALLNSFWQGVIVAALVWLLLLMIKRVSATTRHAVWFVCLLTIGALPIIAIVSARRAPPADSMVRQIEREKGQGQPEVQPAGPELFSEADRSPVVERIARLGRQQLRSTVKTHSDRSMQESMRESTPGTQGTQSTQATPVHTANGNLTMNEFPAPLVLLGPVRPMQMTLLGSSGEPSQSYAGSFSRRAESWGANIFRGRAPVIIIAIWLAGCAFMLLRIARSYGSLLLLRRRLGVVPATQRERARHLAQVFGIRRRVRVFVCRQISMPMTVGAFRPMIVLPPDLVRTLSASEFESVIAHELAHIKRWDYLINLTQRLVQAALFFHPAVWFVSKHLTIERELACDDWAVKTCEPHGYASCLTRLVELLSESKPLAAATGILFGKNVISRRIEMILDRDRNATTAVSKTALAYALGLAAGFVCVCSLLSPAIAVPLAQGPAAKPEVKRESQGKADTATKSQRVKPAPPVAPFDVPDVPNVPDVPDVPDVPELPDRPEAPVPPAPPVPPTPPAIEDLEIGVLEVAPPALISPGAVLVRPKIVGPNGLVQDDKKKAPPLPENELLNVLTDIVKRDSDPAVRNEALRGIYRMRSDASINALIQLYDAIGDLKVKGEIIGYLMRRNGDNSKAIAKLTSIAKSETNEELRDKAIRSLAGVRGDEGANNLIQIYDSLQDPKMKQTVIRYLAYDRSRKAVEKLIQIARNDSDPAVRQSAIRGLYGLDGRYYFKFERKPGAKVSILGDGWKFEGPLAFQLDMEKWEEWQKKWEFDGKRREEWQKQWQEQFEKNRELLQDCLKNLKIEGLDKLKIELPKIELKLKNIEKNIEKNINIEIDREKTWQLRDQLRLRLAEANSQLASLSSRYAPSDTKVIEARNLQDGLDRQIQIVDRMLSRIRKPTVYTISAFSKTGSKTGSRTVSGTGQASSWR